MPEKSAIQRIKELDEERAKIFDHAKEEALEKAQQAVAELKALGLTYTLVNGEENIKAKKGDQGGRNKGSVKEGPCSICGFETSPPHDARKHRSQMKKKAFTAAELTEKGLTKV
jgi:hypothetical protein